MFQYYNYWIERDIVTAHKTVPDNRRLQLNCDSVKHQFAVATEICVCGEHTNLMQLRTER